MSEWRTVEEYRAYGPIHANHPSVGKDCPACHAAFAEGDYTTLVALGPGADEEERANAREGRVYNAVALECHYACVTGFEYKEETDE